MREAQRKFLGLAGFKARQVSSRSYGIRREQGIETHKLETDERMLADLRTYPASSKKGDFFGRLAMEEAASA